MENNCVITAVNILERVLPRLHYSSRETIKRSQLIQIEQTLTIALKSLHEVCKEPLILTPLMESINLIDTLKKDNNFIETDKETKEILNDRVNSALGQLYLFAGKFYMENDFTFSIGKTDVLINIVDYCINAGYYFGYDKELREKGLI